MDLKFHCGLMIHMIQSTLKDSLLYQCNKKNLIFIVLIKMTSKFLNILLNFLHNSIKKSMNFKLCMHGGTERLLKN